MDRNFLAGTCISCVAGGVTLGGMALAPELLSQLYGYPVQDIGYMMAPRGLGAILLTPAMPFAMRQFGLRVPMATGMLMIAFANWQMSTLTLQSDSTLIYFSGLIQGFGGTLMWTPLSMLTYSTLPAHLRNDGAALYILMRALGTAVGISLLQTFTLRSAILAHAELAGTVLLQNLPQAMRDFASGGTTSEVAAMVNGEVTRQAGMIAYNRAFSLMILLNLLQLPLLAIAGKSAARRISAGSS
jgi:DHA2 family multidrug resistance protein